MYEGTALSTLKLSSKEIEEAAIGKPSLAQSKSLFFNATKNFERAGSVIIDDIERLGQIMFNILGSRNYYYDVKIQWDLMEPRTRLKWLKRFQFSCTCPGFKHHGSSDRFCQHILFILMLLFKVK